MTETPDQQQGEEPQEEASSKPKCGIVMPISECDGQPASHWQQVLRILRDAISKAGFEGDLVCHGDDSGVIHKRIIQNLYTNDMVVCDVSGKNANVMFELGMRLTFDKPTVIVCDQTTSRIFDIDPVERIPYRRDLRYHDVIEFQNMLVGKLKATWKEANSEGGFSFLKCFGEFKVRKLETKEVSGSEMILYRLDNIERGIRKLRFTPLEARKLPSDWSDVAVGFELNSELYKHGLWDGGDEQEAILTAATGFLEILWSKHEPKESAILEVFTLLVAEFSNVSHLNIFRLVQVLADVFWKD